VRLHCFVPESSDCLSVTLLLRREGLRASRECSSLAPHTRLLRLQPLEQPHCNPCSLSMARGLQMDKCKRHAAVARVTLQPLSFHLQEHFRNAGQRIDEHDAGGLLGPTPALAVCLEGFRLAPSLLLARTRGRGGRETGFRSCWRTMRCRSLRALHTCVIFSLI
jgi:hypothetical protein